MYKYIGYSLAALIFCVTSLYGQDSEFTTDEGEVVEGEFLIKKDLEITLPTAQRLFEKVSKEELEAKESEPISYTFKEYTPQLSDIKTRLRVLKLKDPKITTKPASYLNLGFGNFITPYAELGVNSGSNAKGSYGIKLHHLSSRNGPVDKENSGDSHSSIDLYGKHAGSKASISGDLSYNRDGYHFYGYDEGEIIDRDSIKQTFNDINLGFEIRNADVKSELNYLVYGKLYNISDRYDASEFGFKGGLFGGYAINDEMTARLGLDYVFASYKNPETISRSLVRVYPSFVYDNGDLRIDGGFKVTSHNDTLNNKQNTRIFPAIKVGYNLSDNFNIYANLDGDIDEVTYKGIVTENPYVAGDLPVSHTIKSFDLSVGIKGNVVENLAFDAGIRAASYKNLYFYLNDPMAINRFIATFDTGNTSLFQAYGSLSYLRGSTVGSTLMLKYNGYGTDLVDKAWHRPSFEMDFSLWYNFYDKIKLYTDFFVLSGIKAIDYTIPSTENQEIKLNAAVDLNLKVDYMLSEKYTVFVSVNNILNKNYQLYSRYPTRGLLAMIGVSISF